tara:strand:+ start:274 stop:1056 length:783 start_codon:yes stop_codon:yes gene_type:complete
MDNIVDEKLDKIDKTVDSIITNKINAIMEQNPDIDNPTPVSMEATVIEDEVREDSTPPDSWLGKPEESIKAVEQEIIQEVQQKNIDKHVSGLTSDDLVVGKTPELVSPVQAETFRKIENLERNVVELMSAVVELTKSHDALVTNIQSSVLERMKNVKPKQPRRKAPLYTEEQEAKYKKMLDHFTNKSGKTQRDLTNGVNQMIASAYDYTVGKPGNSNTADHILAKVAKDHEIDMELYLSVDGYLKQVEEYVLFITKSSIE